MAVEAEAATLERLVESGQAYEAYAHYRSATAAGEAGDPLVHYWGIQALARRGFVVEALNIYLRQDWSGETHEKFRLVPARLLKELFFQTGERHAFLAERALAIYAGEFERSGRVFPGINAAFLSLVLGRREEAGRIAEAIAADLGARLGPIGGAPAAASDTAFDVYALYDALTLVEAEFIRGRGGEALPLLQALADQAGAEGRGAIENSLKQLGRIARLSGQPEPAVKLGGRRGACAHYAAPEDGADPLLAPGSDTAAVEAARARFAERLRTDGVVNLTGGAAPGFELAMAAAAIGVGLPVRLVLPYDGTEYRAREIEPRGEPWTGLFDAVVAGAEAVSAFGGVPDDGGGDGGSGMAARRLLEETRSVAAGLVAVEGASQGRDVLDLGDLRPSAGRRADEPTAAEHAARLPRSTFVASIFCDLVGASKLRERDCVAIFATLYRRVAETMARTASMLEANTWGDAIFLVFSDVREAAAAALDIRRITDGILAENLELDVCFRVACHYGPAFEIEDPVRGVRAFTGASVTKAARIEPVTPPGNVYVTQSFAGKLMAVGAAGYTLEPVGRIKLAKSYGTEGVFNLRRSDFDITERELRLLRAHFAPPPGHDPPSAAARPGA